jgi:hypothetical protein
MPSCWQQQVGLEFSRWISSSAEDILIHGLLQDRRDQMLEQQEAVPCVSRQRFTAQTGSTTASAGRHLTAHLHMLDSWLLQ